MGYTRRIWSVLVLACSIIILVAGCKRTPTPQVMNYPQPTIRVNLDAPWEQGCPRDESTGGCVEDSFLWGLGCENIQPPGDLIGALSPNLPINLCLARREPGKGLSENVYLYREGCRVQSYVRYVIYRDGEFEVLQSQADLGNVFSPIDTPDEALSYAIASTGNGVRYGLEPVKDYRYFVDELQDTNVLEIDDGYRVLLFDYELCGCGPHTTFAVELRVSRDGDVNEISRQGVYEDPTEDDLCVD